MARKLVRLDLTRIEPVWWKSILLPPVPALLLVFGYGSACAFGFAHPLSMLVGGVTLSIVFGYVVLAVIHLVRAAAPATTPAARARRLFFALCLVGGLVALWPAFPATQSLGLRARQRNLAAVAERGAPLVAALERYREDDGNYPISLQELVPDYLDEIPRSPIGVAREFHYERADRASTWRSIATQPRPSYEVSVQFGFSDLFRSIRYWPSQEYPERVDGQRLLSLVGNWAYVDD